MSARVRDVMVAAVISSAPEETVGEVREKMSTHDIGAIPVLNPDGVLVGIVTSDDLVADYPQTLPISRVMKAPVQTIGPDAFAREAAALMLKARRHHIVVESKDEVVGIVSSLDLLRLIDRPARP